MMTRRQKTVSRVAGTILGIVAAATSTAMVLLVMAAWHQIEMRGLALSSVLFAAIASLGAALFAQLTIILLDRAIVLLIAGRDAAAILEKSGVNDDDE